MPGIGACVAAAWCRVLLPYYEYMVNRRFSLGMKCGAIVLLEFPMHPINSTRTEFEAKYDAKSQFNFKSEADNIKVDIFAI